MLYWKLDDATGPAASDSSGNSRAGAYGGSFILHQYGVEPTTFAAQFGASGAVSRVGMVQPGTSAWSVVWYASYNVGATPTDTVVLSNGGASGARGFEVHLNSSQQMYVKWWQTNALVTTTGNTTLPVWNRWWHSFAVTWNGTTGMALYVDGSSATNATSPLAMGTVQSTDTFAIIAGYPAVYSHVAYYDKLLSTADIAAICGYRYDWPFGPMVNLTWPEPPAGGGGALSPSDPVVIDINTDLSELKGYVSRQYPTSS